ncbi:MAG: hypothetical protein ACRDYA_20080 [Egibacteraceae bacterium]
MALADAAGQVLSPLEKAIVVKEDLSLERRFKLTCSHCATKWLGEVPPQAGEAERVVAVIESGMTKRQVQRLAPYIPGADRPFGNHFIRYFDSSRNSP